MTTKYILNLLKKLDSYPVISSLSLKTNNYTMLKNYNYDII